MTHNRFSSLRGGITIAIVSTLIAVFFGTPLLAAASTVSKVTLPFSYTFSTNGSLDETQSQTDSSSSYFWLTLGGRMNITNGTAYTLAGNQSTASTWYKYYNVSNPVATDNGLHPQNVFTLFARSTVQSPTMQVYVKRDADNLTNTANRNPWIGESLLLRYVDANNFYYAGIRADGDVVIKKKMNGVYTTLAENKLLPGTYNQTSNPDLIPKNVWIGLKGVVTSDAGGNPVVSLYTDQGKTGTWTLALQTTDSSNPINSPGLVGIQSDFADAEFDDLSITENATTQTVNPPTQSPAANVLFSDAFSEYSDGLLTNEYTYWNPTDPNAKQSSKWEMTSGSLFTQGGTGWTGVPNTGTVSLLSSPLNDSAVFRLTTKQANFGDVAVDFDLLNQGLSSNSLTPATDWDGVHVFLRYQSEYNLYYASINRRDNTVTIKKKIPGGPSNGGTYYQLTTNNPHTVPYGSWQHVKATVKNNADGSVTIQLFANGTLVATATDNGSVGGAPIRTSGKVGIRGDNANLKFKNFTVTSL